MAGGGWPAIAGARHLAKFMPRLKPSGFRALLVASTILRAMSVISRASSPVSLVMSSTWRYGHHHAVASGVGIAFMTA
jgi:hypothetical protein